MTISNFLVRPPLLGNQSGDEDEFESNGTMLILKEEEQSEDSEAEDENSPQKPEKCTVATQVEASDTAVDTGVGTSDSSSEDEEPPAEEATKRAREIVVYNVNKIMVEDPETATAFLQALAKFKFEFHTAKGIKKTCGEDYFNVEIPREAKVKKPKTKQKGTGKNPAPGHISAQEQDPEVLEIDITNEENESLNAETKTTAGLRGRAGEREKERGRKKTKETAPLKSDGKQKRKSRENHKHRWIKFFYAEGT